MAALGGQHGYDHTSYNPHRCAPSRWRRLVRPGTLVLEVKRASTKTSQSIGCEQGAVHKPSNLPSRVCCQYGYWPALTPSGWLQTWQLPELIFGNIRPCLWLATDSKGCGRCHLDQDSPVQRQKNARLSPRQCSILTSRGSTKTWQSIGFSWPNKPKGWVRWRVVNPIEHICTDWPPSMGAGSPNHR